MTKRTWKYYHKMWKFWGDRCFVIANSLHKYPPHGHDPVTKRKFKTSKAFVSALRSAERNHDLYKRLTKKHYKEDTGRNW